MKVSIWEHVRYAAFVLLVIVGSVALLDWNAKQLVRGCFGVQAPQSAAAAGGGGLDHAFFQRELEARGVEAPLASDVAGLMELRFQQTVASMAADLASQTATLYHAAIAAGRTQAQASELARKFEADCRKAVSSQVASMLANLLDEMAAEAKKGAR